MNLLGPFMAVNFESILALQEWYKDGSGRPLLCLFSLHQLQDRRPTFSFILLYSILQRCFNVESF